MQTQNSKIVNLVISLFVMLLPRPLLADAQQPGQVPRVGYLTGTREPTRDAPDANRDAFRRGLRDLGYIEEKNIQIEYRYGAGRTDRAASLVAELIKLNVDVLVSPAFPAISAAKQVTKTIPIIMVINQDPVATGIIDSLARPGGNITGVSRLTRELSGKRLELLKEIVPAMSRVGVLVDGDSRPSRDAFKDYEAAAHALKITLQPLEIRNANPDFDGAFRTAANERVSALITLRNTLLIDNRKRIAQLAIKNRIPSMSEGSVFVEAGSLVSYSSDENNSFRRAAYYVDKILKGVKPADLPVEQPTKFEFVINLKTAKELGLTIPPNVLARADRVIK
jgi:putative ABC transport system substrate-binding protein